MEKCGEFHGDLHLVWERLGTAFDSLLNVFDDFERMIETVGLGHVNFLKHGIEELDSFSDY